MNKTFLNVYKITRNIFVLTIILFSFLLNSVIMANMKTNSLKTRILEILGENNGSCFSGQELADRLGVTRTAVWKAVEALRNEGYRIEGIRKLGYRLAPDTELLNSTVICSRLDKDAASFFSPECFETVTSTNLLLKERAADGAPEGLVLIAENQTKGRGRLGRSFYSPKNSGIYFSILLRPMIPASDAVLMTAAAAAAGAQALEAAFPMLPEGSVQIKWVNDLYLNDHKICGILTEGMLSIESASLEYAVVGVGFNLAEPEGGWPEELKGIAGGLPEEAVGIGARAKLVSAFLNQFLPYYRGLSERTFLKEYRKRQLVSGKHIEVFPSGMTEPVPGSTEARKALALGIDKNCRLLVLFEDDGTEQALNSGEVRVRAW